MPDLDDGASIELTSPAQPASTSTSTPAAAAAKPPTSVPPLLLAHRWDGEADLTGWWISEKLDGVRAYWDGARLLSRLGNPFAPPPRFLAGLPDTPLDGELWIGRKQFQKTTSIVRRQDRSAGWNEVLYAVFDAPALQLPFEQRAERCRALLATLRPPHARWHEHVRCAALEHLREQLARVTAQGGEGLMLRRPGSLYEAGRSFTLLKVKTFHDAEGRVVQHVPGKGKHQGRLGALVVEMPGGVRFNVGTGFTDAQRESPPPLGSIVTYRYQELSNGGVPRFPSFVGLRVDVDAPTVPAGPVAKPKPPQGG